MWKQTQIYENNLFLFNVCYIFIIIKDERNYNVRAHTSIKYDFKFLFIDINRKRSEVWRQDNMK